MQPIRMLLPLLLLIATNQARADAVDQEFLGPGTDAVVSIDEIFPRAQTFTVGLAGTLTRIDLSLARGSATLDTDELTIDVRPTDENGAPLDDDGAALAVVTIPATGLGELLDPQNLFQIDLSPFAIGVAPGDRLAIAARAGVPFFGGRAFYWGARIVTGDGHPGGIAWFRTSPDPWALQNGGGVDLVFRTWVPEPGPATAALAAFATLALCSRRRSTTTS